MKRKIFAVLIAVFTLLSLVFCVTGCNEESGFDPSYIVGSYIDADGNLIIVLADGTELNYGKVRDDRPSVAGYLFSEVLDGEEIVGYSVRGLNTETSLNLVIPDTFCGKPVIEIADGAFYMNDKIVSVTIPDTVKRVGAYSFEECTALERVDFGKGVTVIAESAFGSCYSLKEIDIPQSVKRIEESAFVVCTSLEKVTLPMAGALEYIGDGAFAGCHSLKSFIMPDSVKEIGYGLFMQCTSLSTVALSDNLTFISEYAFSQCSSLKTFTFGIKSKVTRIGYAAFDRTAIQSITIPLCVTEIGGSAFYKCYNLSTVNLNSNLERLGDGIFQSCTALEEITIPSRVNYIGQYAFDGCENLISVVFKNYEDWKVYEEKFSQTGVAISSMALSNPSNAANYLKSLHRKRFWLRGNAEFEQGSSGVLPW